MIRNAIITGGAGFIGLRLAQRMLEAGWNVFIIDDYSTHLEPEYQIPPKALYSNSRVQDHSYYKFNDFPPDLIVHLAGKVGPVGVTKFKGKIVKDTVDAATTVRDWALHFECPLIFTSTSEVYGDDSKSNSEEDNPSIKAASARSEYAVAKLAAEHMLINTDGLQVKIIRPFNISGYGQRIDGGFVIPRFVQQAFEGEPLTVYYPGTQQRSFTHVDDFLDGVALAYQKGDNKEIYNVGNELNKMTIAELAQQVIGRTRSRSVLKFVDPVEIHGPLFKEAPDKIPNNEKLRRLGWNPWRGTGEIVADVIGYYRERLDPS